MFRVEYLMLKECLDQGGGIYYVAKGICLCRNVNEVEDVCDLIC